MDPRHPVFPLDGSDIPPGESAWWDTWNSSGDVTAHDNYPLRPWTEDLEALAQSVSRAVHLNGERKPVWITLQAFGGAPGLSPPARIPTPEELRGMAFTAIIHGATGLILFAYDSWATREGNVIGIAPETAEGYGKGRQCHTVQAAQSRALWAGATALNAELARLAPRILSPTARLAYEVSFSGTCPDLEPDQNDPEGNGRRVHAAGGQSRGPAAGGELPVSEEHRIGTAAQPGRDGHARDSGGCRVP